MMLSLLESAFNYLKSVENIMLNFCFILLYRRLLCGKLKYLKKHQTLHKKSKGECQNSVY